MTESIEPISTPKRFRHGTHRLCSPEETIARLRPQFDRVGITRIANLTGLDRTGVPVVAVCRPNSRSSAVFHGKGIDLAAAKASGLMEAVETWHAERVELPLKLASFSEMHQSHAVADVEDLPRRPDGRFQPDLPMLWVEGLDLISNDRLWLPFETVHANSTLREQPGCGCFSASTNGLASGNCYLEAVSHGLCEVIERDATSLWHRSPRETRAQTQIALETVADPDCAALLAKIEAADLDVGAWETTTDVGVPSFQCAVLDRRDVMAHVGNGAGCHPTRSIALLRALTEAVQVRTTYIVGSREDIQHKDYDPATLAARNRHERALMGTEGGARDFPSGTEVLFDSFEEEVAWLLERVQAARVPKTDRVQKAARVPKTGPVRQAVAVDLTRAEFGISVVRVVVPGLEGSDHHAGYAPGPRALAAAAAGEK